MVVVVRERGEVGSDVWEKVAERGDIGGVGSGRGEVGRVEAAEAGAEEMMVAGGAMLGNREKVGLFGDEGLFALSVSCAESLRGGVRWREKFRSDGGEDLIGEIAVTVFTELVRVAGGEALAFCVKLVMEIFQDVSCWPNGL